MGDWLSMRNIESLLGLVNRGWLRLRSGASAGLITAFAGDVPNIWITIARSRPFKQSAPIIMRYAHMMYPGLVHHGTFSRQISNFPNVGRRFLDAPLAHRIALSNRTSLAQFSIVQTIGLILLLSTSSYAQNLGGGISGPSSGGGGGGITVFSGATALTGTLYFPIGGGSLPSGTEAQSNTFSPAAATVSNFYVKISAAPGMGTTIVFTWRDGASSQSLTCTITGAVATTCSDLTHHFSAAQGDALDIQAVVSGGVIAGTPNLIMSAQFGTTSSPSGPTTNQNIRTIGANFGSFQSGATALASALTSCVPVYYAGSIQAVEIIGNVSGSITIDVQTVLHSAWTGTASVSSITAADIPALAAASKYTDTTLTGWTTTLAAGTDVCFVMSSPTTVAGASITLKVAAN